MPAKDMKTYQNEWIKKRRLDWIRENGPCAHCGSVENLQVDHIDPSQKVSHRVWSWRAERRLAELSKCQVLCHICHQKKTKAQNYTERNHGEQRTYDAGCRCDLCKATAVKRVLDWRARTGRR